MAAPTGAITVPYAPAPVAQSAPSPVVSASSPAGDAPPTPAVATVTPGAPLPGANPRDNTPIDGAALTTQAVSQIEARGGNPLTPFHSSASSTTSAASSATSSASSASPLPLAATNIITGFITGFILQAGTGTALQGATVTAYGNAGQNCPVNICVPQKTTSNGSFGFSTAMKAPVGPDYIEVDYLWNLTNYSYFTVYVNQTTSLGNIYVSPDALAWGYVYSNTTTPKPIGGILVCGSSRDQVIQVSCSPSLSNGSFTVAFPPMPSIIRFSSTFGYLSDFRFVNGTPHYAGYPLLYLGKIYLTRLVAVKATLCDAAAASPPTCSPVPSGSCAPFPGAICRSLTVCNAIQNTCQSQGVAVGTATVVAMGVPGASYVQAYATGYVTNTVNVGNLSKVDPGTVINVGKIWMVPMGATSFRWGITTNKTNTANMWSTGGMVYANIASMQGYATAVPQPNAFFGVNLSVTGTLNGVGCAGIGTTVTIPAFPGRNDIKTSPDYQPVCNIFPTWPIPSSFPIWGNETWMNATPNENTYLGWFNFTPGSYVYGKIQTSGASGLAPRNYSVTAVSTSQPGIFTPYPFIWTYAYSSGSYREMNNGWACSGITSVNSTFCVPVPPGDYQIQVNSIDNLPQNFTWGFNHNICCVGYAERTGVPLSTATLDHEQTINLTAQGRVEGRVVRLGTNLGVTFGAVQICSAGTSIIPGLACGNAVVLPNGSFSAWAPVGWDYLTGSGAGYESNTVWAYVSPGRMVNVGNMTLTPRATIDGFVVNPQGNPISGATVKTCILTSTSACSPLGLGATNTYGYYNGTLAGGWLPWATFEVLVSAPGYDSDWTFINATAGVSTQAKTLTLYPVGSPSGAAPTPRASSGSAPSSLVWVYGTAIDNLTEYGVQGASVTACSTASGNCFAFGYTTNSLGQFNESIPAGIYALSITSNGYLPRQLQITALGPVYTNVGTITMDPFHWVSGHVALYPWSTDGSGFITVPKSFGSKTNFNTLQLGPVASVTACTAGHTICGVSAVLSTQGNFTAETPTGNYLQVTVNPTGAPTGPTVQGGSTTNNSNYNATAWQTNLSNSINSLVFPSISAYIRDGSSVNPVDSTTGWLPVQFSAVGLTTFGPSHGSVNYNANGGGWIVFFVPPGPNKSAFFVGPGLMYAASNLTFNQTLAAGGNYTMPNLTLQHFGWIDVHIVDSVSNLPAPYVTVSASFTDEKNLTSYSVAGTTNGGGLANVSSMFGKPILVTVGGTNDYNNTTFSTRVNESETTLAYSPNGLTLDHWGWVRSYEVNNSTGLALPTIVDFAKGLPLPGADVSVASTDLAYGSGSSQPSSWYGQFVSDAPIGNYDIFTVSHLAYQTNTTHIRVRANETSIFRTINVSGDGVIAGRVVGLPTLTPIKDAAIQLCAPRGACFTASTNSSGVFWILAPPGLDSVTATADGYVTNSSAPALACSDCWTWMGTIELAQFATIQGTVRGLPSGLPIGNANVSLCSPLGTPTGPCGFWNLTAPDGSFIIKAPAGTYVLAAGASYYNISYRPVALSPGQHAQAGTIFLEKFGQLRGFVYSATTLVAVAGASVYACARWSGGNCTPTTLTDSVGSYALAGPPGPYLLTISAPGYADGYQRATISTGGLTPVPPVLLTPLGIDQSFQISGNVVNASNPSQGIAGAIVSLRIGGSPAFSTSTNSQGAYSFQAVWGTYVLTVSAPGYRPLSQPLVVNGPISALNLALSVMTYNVTGVVRDGLNLQPLQGVTLSEGGTVLAQTLQDGSYLLTLPNGTHFLTASYTGSLAVPYTDVAFSVTVNGLSLQHDLDLLPQTALVRGIVVDSLTGLPLANAVVNVRGLAVDGVPITQTLTSDASGAFSVSLPAGSYNASSTYSGYLGAAVTFSTVGTAPPVTLALKPTGTAASVPSSSLALVPILAVLGVVLAVIVVVALFVQRSRRPPARSTAPARRPPANPSGPSGR